MKKIKNKILSGLIFILIVISLLSLSAVLSIYYLSKDSDAIIKDNYASVEYANLMLSDLEDIFMTQLLVYTGSPGKDSLSLLQEQLQLRIIHFNETLKLQKLNITEPGEQLLVEKISGLSSDYISFVFKNQRLSDSTYKLSEIELLRSKYNRAAATVKQLYRLNMSAVIDKYNQAHSTADKVSLYMSITAAGSIIITLIFIFYFPGYITKPIIELTKKIEDISEKRYDQRLNVQSKDELSKLAAAFNKMAVRLKEYEAKHIDELLLEKRRMETLVLNLQDGTMLLDNQLNILHVNPKFCELSGLGVNDLLGKQITELGNKSELLARIGTFDIKGVVSAAANKLKPLKITINKQAGYFQLLILPIQKELKTGLHEEPSGYIMLIQNITQFEERDLAKTDLISTISHELKTPLSSINLAVKLLEHERIGTLNAEQKELLQSVKLHTSRLLSLVNEVLDYTQAETGHIRLTIEPCEVNDIIELATFAILMLMNEKELELTLLVPENLPKVKCDLEKTVWVMVNLLNNGIRYSKHGGRLTIQAKVENAYMFISVKDEGPGIKSEDHAKIFNKYVKSKSDSSKGTGLGLAIAKEFVEEQGGRIGVESTPGYGCKFYFSLPLA